MKTSYTLFALRNLRRMIAFSTLIIFSGCSSPSSGPSSSANWNVAKTGSIFTFRDYDIDSLGNSTFKQIVVDSIESDGQTLGGMTNVSAFLEGVPGHLNPISHFVAYATNGDFAFGDSTSSGPNGMNWITLPTGSHQLAATDTNYNNGTRQIRTISYDGTIPMQIAGRNFTVIKTTTAFRDSSSSSIFDGLDSRWYAPELGFFTKIEQRLIKTSTDSFGNRVTAWHSNMEVLDSYQLK
jgi:hypothetical protein